MKSSKFSALVARTLTVASLTLAIPAISHAGSPGQGWDAFGAGASNVGIGEPILVAGKLYLGTALQSSTPGQGWDAFASGAVGEGVGEAISIASSGYRGTSLEAAPSLESDAFRTGNK